MSLMHSLVVHGEDLFWVRSHNPSNDVLRMEYLTSHLRGTHKTVHSSEVATLVAHSDEKALVLTEANLPVLADAQEVQK